MKTKTLILWLFLSTTVCTFAYDFQSGDLRYNITSDNTVAVASGGGTYEGLLTSVIIPESVTYNGITYSVTNIDNYAFSGCAGLTSVAIGNSVTYIGEQAFYNCTGLTSITIPNSVTSIGDKAFYHVFNIVYSGTATGSPWGAKSVNGYVEGYLVYSDSTKTALQGCSTAATGAITIPNSVTAIGESAFEDCDGLASVTIPNSVTSIGDMAFFKCDGLTSVTIPNSVTSIGYSAFAVCASLTSITIPDGVTSIGRAAFYGTPWYYNQPDGVIYINNLLYAYKGDMPQGTNIVVKSGTTSIVGTAFWECSGLTSITIPNSVTSIGEQAFYNCTGLTSITIPNSVTSIGYYAFEGTPWYENQPNGVLYIGSVLYEYKDDMPQGTNLVIKEGTTTIGAYAFEFCDGLTSVTIPNSVTSIEKRAFFQCMGLTSVTIPNSVTSIGEDAFRLVTNVIYSGTATGAPWGAMNMNRYVEGYLLYSDSTKTALLRCSTAATGEIIIPNSVTSIGDYAFQGCTGITSVIIPNTVTSIGYKTFSGCTSLTSVTIPDGVTSIISSAFYNCTSLTSVTIPNSVTYIGDQAFSGCTSLTSVTIPDGVTSIISSAFYNCTSLTSVTIPNSVTYIGDQAFSYCTGLTSITLPNTITSIGYMAFQGCTNLTSVTIPNSVTNIDRAAFQNCTSLTSITIPNSVTSIGVNAFRGCAGLTSVAIGNSVTTIECYAFSGCTGLESVSCQAVEPPAVDSTALKGVDLSSVLLYVPNESIDKYAAADVWKDFKEIKAISATPVEADEPILTPEENKVTITWPTTDDTTTYTIEISEDATLVCTLTFNANGVLQSMRSAAPARYATQHTTQAEATSNGFCFVVEGLDYATTYTYTITATDKDDIVLTNYSGTFTTKKPVGTGMEDTLFAPSQPASRKVFRDGQVYILRGGKTYNINGTEVK